MQVGDPVDAFGEAGQAVSSVRPGHRGVVGSVGVHARSLEGTGVQRVQDGALDHAGLGFEERLPFRGEDAHDQGAGLPDPGQEALGDVGERIGPDAGPGHADVPLAHHPCPVRQPGEHDLASQVARAHVGVQIRVAILHPLEFGGLGLQPHDPADVDVAAAPPPHGFEGEPDEPLGLVLSLAHAQAVAVEEGVREQHVGVGGVEEGAGLLLLHEAVRHELLDRPRYEGLPLHEVAEDALLVLHGAGFGVHIPLVLHGVVAVDGCLVGEGCRRQRLARLFPHPRHVQPAFRAQHATALALDGDVGQHDRLHRDHQIVGDCRPGGQLQRGGGRARVADPVRAQRVGAGPRGAQHEGAQIVGQDASRLCAGRVGEHDHGSGEGRAAALLQHAPSHDLGGGAGSGGAGQSEPDRGREQRAASAIPCFVCRHRLTLPPFAVP